MALTAQQDIPNKPKGDSEPWTVRRLFPLAALTSAISKTFVNPFDILLSFSILVIGIAELIGRHVELGFWVLVILLVIADLLERHLNRFLGTQKVTKKK